MKLARTFLLLAVFVFYGEGAAAESRPSEKPNILIILADDLGWSDLGCYGNSTIATPHLDQLAREGMRFTQAYAAAPICSPSRAALLTGKSPARLHFEFVSKPDGSRPPAGTRLRQPPFPRDLALDELTLAEAIDPSYRTGYFGKWHLTQNNDRYLGWGNSMGPLQQGFDQGSEDRGSHPYTFTQKEKTTFDDMPKGSYPEDQLTRDAISFIESAGNRPFLLYYSMYYVHTPVRTRSAWLIEKYKQRLGPDATDKAIHYAAFVETMDAYIGQLLRALAKNGQAENTVVIFLSDNGGHPSFTSNGPLRGSKWNLYEGGVRVPMIVRWPGSVQPGTTCQVPVTGMDIFPTIHHLSGSRTPLPDSLDGQDLTPLLRNPSGVAWQRSTLYWHFPFYHPAVVDTRPQSSVRVGDFKLLYFYEDDRTELFDLARDPGERQDLSSQMPEKAQELKRILDAKLRKVNARFPTEKQ